MSTPDKFKRVYPILATALLLPLCLVPPVIAWIQGSDAVIEVFSSVDNLILIGNSILFALICSFISLLLGLPGAYLIAKYDFKLKGLFRWIFPFLMLVPTSILALSLKPIFTSLFGKLPDLIPIGIVLVLSNTPLYIYFVSSRWLFLDENCEDSAKTLGSRPVRTFLSVTTPRLRSELAFSFSLAFIRCFSDISAFRILGDAKYMNLYAKAYDLWQSGNRSAAQILSLVSSLISLVALLVMFLDSWQSKSEQKHMRSVRGFLPVFLTVVYLFVSFAVFAYPICFFLFKLVFVDGSFTITLPAVFGSVEAIGTRSLINSAIISVAAAVLCTFIAKRLSFAVARNGFSTIVAFLPLVFGAAALGMGFSALERLLPFLDPIILAVLATVIRLIPVAVLVLLSAILGIPEDYTDVSKTLGFSGRASFRHIDSKLLRPSVLESFFIVFLLSFGEFGTPAFLGMDTVPTTMIASLESGDINGANALAAILLLICLAFYSVSFALNEKGTSNV